MKTYSPRKARHLLKTVHAWWQANERSLDTETNERLKRDLHSLDDAIVTRDREQINTLANKLELFAKSRIKKGPFEYVKEFVVAIVVALVIAVVVRQMWFELYEIPTGSMRPTLREEDHLSVSKTQFGLNIPLMTAHFLFEPDLVERGGIVIFSGDKIPSMDQTINYFNVLPYMKRYVKRLVGKPGDSIYFYGGQLYGVDKEGHPLKELRDPEWMKSLEYVPMIAYEGTLLNVPAGQLQFQQFGQTIGRLLLNSKTTFTGQIFNGKEWLQDNPLAQKNVHNTIETYSDFWGMRNYAIARLLTPEELSTFPDLPQDTTEGALLYLELKHTPSLSFPSPLVGSTGRYQLQAMLNPYKTVIPLRQEQLQRLLNAMYTARFVVKDGLIGRYNAEAASSFNKMTNPDSGGSPNGTYDMYGGKISKISWGGYEEAVDADFPLYTATPSNVQMLFNLGIDFNKFFSPSKHNPLFFPNRYAYFREGSLFVMGAPLFDKGDPALEAFQKSEQQREASKDKPYVAFKDYGPPIRPDGSYDVDFIRTFGVTVPGSNYLVLGDNHAMSSDSRIFGFVPEANLQGVPELLLWPPGKRFGSPSQYPYPTFTLPRLIVWSIAALIALAWWLWTRRSLSKKYLS